jgi:teichuronic acid biosynthesis glycosyltransferase TuaG
MSPTVSVITPAYNAAGVVGQAIGSVQSQTFPDWEMLVVDDCSTDDTVSVTRNFAGTDGRVRLLHQPVNAGPANARNAALKAARGRYVAFLDSDDLWLPRKLELQLAFMAENRAAISYTAYRRFDPHTQSTGVLIPARPAFNYRALLGNPGIACLTAIVDRERTGPFAMPPVRHEDFALWLSLLRGGLEARGLNVDLARYRVSETSVSSNKLRSATWVWNIYRNIEGLSLPYAGWCLTHYAINAIRKRRIESSSR